MNLRKTLFHGVILYLMTGCTPLEDPNTVKADDKLYLIVQNNKKQLKADGKDYAYLLARLPEESDAFDVTFSTTGGVFIYSNDKSVKGFADSVSGGYRYATALLKSDTTAKTVYVTAEITQARNQTSLTFIK